MDYTSWTLVHEASKMNEAGVDAFASGHSQLAIEHLNNALVIINKLLLLHCDQYDLATRAQQAPGQLLICSSSSRVPTTSTNCNRRQCNSRSRTRQTGISSSPVADEITVKPKTVEFKALQDERFYIHNRALLFTPPPASDSSCCPYLVCDNASFQEIRKQYIQVSFFWSIVHFNMALVLHKLIHETQEYDRRYREEAILFYKLCLQNLWVIPSSSPTMNFLMLCAVNNLVHVYLNMHNHATSCLGGGSIHLDTSSLDLKSNRNKRIKRSHPTSVNPLLLSRMDDDAALVQKELVQAMLLRAIGKVISNDRSLTEEEHEQVTEMSVNHIVISALCPSYVAPGA